MNIGKLTGLLPRSPHIHTLYIYHIIF